MLMEDEDLYDNLKREDFDKIIAEQLTQFRIFILRSINAFDT